MPEVLSTILAYLVGVGFALIIIFLYARARDFWDRRR